MFKSARIKLTTWYLLIIMAVSFSFSAFIYRSVSLEFQRRLNAIETRLELRRYGLRPPPGQIEFFIGDLKEARKRVLFVLVYTNAVIFVISAAAGYFLAGKTFIPIEKALEEQKRFVADASHELKTPLTSLQTSMEVALRDKRLNLRSAKEALRESLKDVQSLASLSNYLLGLARFQKDSNFEKETFNIKDIIKEAGRQITPLAKNKEIKFRLDSMDVMIYANKESLEKLITILLDNAVKYTKEDGKVSVTAKKEKRRIIIEVKDTGVGICRENLPHIFERFYRAESSRCKEEIAGFGLGLAMAKEIVDLHKGAIDVKSEAGKGSTFTVSLPISN